MPQSFARGLFERMPPWFRRTRGGAFVLGLGDQLDVLAQQAADAVKHRFPVATSDADALALLGAERRILRGPREDAATYASRLLTWWDDHRGRGGPYALARQIWGYWRTSINPPFEIVYTSGRRFSVSTSGVVTRDDISWSAPAAWAQYWIFFHLTGLTTTFVDELGDVVVTDTGATLVFDTLTGGAVTEEEAAQFTTVPREWSPAHVQRVNVVLLYGTGWYLGQPGVVLGDGHSLSADGYVGLTITDF